MQKTLIYDFPTRVFHWLFSGLFISAFLIAKTIEDESVVFSYHMLMGLTLAGLVVLRVIWGFIGSRHAKFTDFELNPARLLSYFKGLVTGDKKKWAGHNPASSWAALVMMLLALGSAVTGYLMTAGKAKENLEDIHEIFANLFVLVALTHVAGIIIHSIRHREMLGLAMLSGKKDGVSQEEGIHNSHKGLGLLLFGIVAAFGFSLFKNFDTQTGILNLGITTLTLGESKDESVSPEKEEEEEEELDT